jgi:hypothetical protein
MAESLISSSRIPMELSLRAAISEELKRKSAANTPRGQRLPTRFGNEGAADDK